MTNLSCVRSLTGLSLHVLYSHRQHTLDTLAARHTRRSECAGRRRWDHRRNVHISSAARTHHPRLWAPGYTPRPSRAPLRQTHLRRRRRRRHSKSPERGSETIAGELCGRRDDRRTRWLLKTSTSERPYRLLREGSQSRPTCLVPPRSVLLCGVGCAKEKCRSPGSRFC